MTGGSGSSTENYAVRLAIDPVIIRATEMLGTGSNLGAKLTDILNILLTDRLEDINVRILECQANDLKNEDAEEEGSDSEDEESAEVSKRSITVQQQLLALRHLLSSYKASESEKQEANLKVSEITLNLAQFAVLQTLGNKKTRSIDLDLGSLLLDLGNGKLAQLKARLAKELAATGAQPTSVDKPNPALLQQKDFLSLLGELEELIEKMLARSRRVCMVQRGIKVLADTCANVLQVPASDIQSAAEKMLQKEQSSADSLSFQTIYDEFKQNVKDFDLIAQQVSLERKQTPQLGKSQIPKLLKKKTRKKAAVVKKKVPKEETPSPAQLPPIEISDITILDNLTSDPISMRDLLTKMHIVDMSDARFLQLQLRQLEKANKIQVTTVRGSKCFSKS